MTTRLARRIAAVAALVLAAAAFAPAGAHAAEDPYTPILGSGSSWSKNAIDFWRSNVSTVYGMNVEYNGEGSTRGRTDYIGGVVDFGVSEIPFQPAQGSTPAEVSDRPYAYMPIVAGGTAFMYNLVIGGKRVTNLRLSGEVITKIFLGQITNWNDPAIQADNPGLTMPDKGIVPVVRSDGSGTSAQFTLWMSTQFGTLWTTGMTSQFPTPSNGKAQAQSTGVAGYVSQSYGDGAITYVEYSYAVNAKFPVAKVLNRAGYYIEPTADSVAVALLRARINSDLTQDLGDVYNSDDPRTYPLSSYSYMIIPTSIHPNTVFTADRGRSLGAFLSYVLCEGQQRMPELGYSPLPMNLVLAAFEQVKRIPGAVDVGVDINSCRNPTFQPGDSPDRNQLALTAAQPADCDKQGPAQCTTGTGGARGETPTSNGGGAAGGGAGSGGGAGGGGSDGSAGAGDAAENSGGAVYDDSGMLISDGGGSGVGGAVSSPFTVEAPGMGVAQWLMLAAAALLIIVIVAPALFTRRRSEASTEPSSRGGTR